ncbi:MAG: hypothetical protein HPY59_07155 [Anaerolineae bacterium]|nr:hypothetical protein [Anaerolineae bacterium]
MLERLLDEIRAGGTFETSALAARLGTTPKMVEAMLAHLKRAGYLDFYQTCGDTCGGCSLSAGCGKPQNEESLSHPPQLFVFSEKRHTSF